MNRKILTSGFSILASLALAGGATFALFTNTGTSSNNVFAAGTLDLKLTDENEAPSDDVTASFGGTNMSPGVCLSPATLSLKNSGTVAGNHVDITASNTDSNFASYLRIDALTYGATDILASLSAGAGNANGIKDLQDLAASTVMNNLPLTDIGVNHDLSMTVCLDDLAPDTVQGGTNTMNLSALLTQ